MPIEGRQINNTWPKDIYFVRMGAHSFFLIWICVVPKTFAATTNETCVSNIGINKTVVHVLDYVTLQCICKSERGNRWYSLDTLVFWGKNPQDLNFPGNTTILQNYSLIIRSVQVQNDGTYECVCNHCVVQRYQLLTEVAPKLNIITSNQVNSNDIVYFEEYKNYSIVCEALGAKPAVNLTLRINNEKACNGCSKFYTSQSKSNNFTVDSFLQLWMQPVGETGNISCTRSSQLISAETEVYSFFRTYVTPRIYLKINGSTLKDDIYVKTENMLVVECITGGSRPSANLTLLIDDMAITDANDTFITKENNLFFSSVTRSVSVVHETVNLSCRANGHYGYDKQHKTVHLITYVAPLIHLTLNDKDVANGTFYIHTDMNWMIAKCHAAGARPAVRLEWRLKGGYLRKNSTPSWVTKNRNATYDTTRTLSFMPQKGNITLTCTAVGEHVAKELHYVVVIFTKELPASKILIAVSSLSAAAFVVILLSVCYTRQKRGKKQQSITRLQDATDSIVMRDVRCIQEGGNSDFESKGIAASPQRSQCSEDLKERRTIFQGMPLPSIPDIKDVTVEEENAYYSDGNKTNSDRCVFQQRNLSFMLKLSSGSIYDRWIVTLSNQNKCSSYVVASTISAESATLWQTTHWDEFATRLLEIPDVEFVVNTQGIYLDGGRLYLIQEHIMCQTLEDYQSKNKEQPPPFSEFETMRLVMNILKGMEFIHSYGFLHPGISRRKILLTKSGQCKLYDFCLNKDASKMCALLKSKGDCSLNDLPLETLTRNEYGQESDSWCTGVVLWEIFSGGISPFSEERHDYVNFGNALMGPTSWPKQALRLRNNYLFECWRKDGTTRPTIFKLKQSFEKMMLTAEITDKANDISNDYMPMGGNLG